MIIMNVTRLIGCDSCISDHESFDEIISKHNSNESVLYIQNIISCHNSSFSFQTVTIEQVYDKLRSLNAKKAPGYDYIPPKLVKVVAMFFVNHLHI